MSTARGGVSRGRAVHALTIATLCLAAGSGGDAQNAPTEIRHEPDACRVRDRSAPVRACVVPRSGTRRVHVLVSAPGVSQPERHELRSDMPCYAIAGERVFKQTGSHTYQFEVETTAGQVVRSAPYAVVVAPREDACTSPGPAPASIPTARPTATARLVPATPRPAPAPAVEPPGSAASSSVAQPTSHRTRGLLLALGGGVAGGAVAVAATRSSSSSPEPTPTPAFDGRIAGSWLGTQTLSYPSGCQETDRIQLRLNERSGQVQGTLTFTVSNCACCAAIHGGDHVTGYWDGARLQIQTTGGIRYDGSVAGLRLQGELRGGGQIAGSWEATRSE